MTNTSAPGTASVSSVREGHEGVGGPLTLLRRGARLP